MAWKQVRELHYEMGEGGPQRKLLGPSVLYSDMFAGQLRVCGGETIHVMPDADTVLHIPIAHVLLIERGAQ